MTFQKGVKPPKKGEKIQVLPKSGNSYKDMIENAKIRGADDMGVLDDPKIREALGEDAIALAEEINDGDTSKDISDAMDALDIDTQLRPHPIGNGVTVPFPWMGEDTPDVATCSKRSPSNRGCLRFDVCPVRGKGPFTIVFANMRARPVRIVQADCLHFSRFNSQDPKVKILPGVDEVPTLLPEYEPLPNGQQPMPGPNQPKTAIRFTKVQNKVACPIPKDLAEEYQRARRRGDA